MDLLTQATASFRRRLLGLSSKDAQFRNEVRHFAASIMNGLAEVPETPYDADVPFPLHHIAACRLKSEAMSHIGIRLRGMMADGLLDLAEAELKEQAKSLNSYLWMLNGQFEVGDLDAVDTIAGCFDTLADALTLVNDFAAHVPDNRRITEPLLRLLAKTQSALREAVRLAGGPEDQEQRRAFQWLRNTAEETQIFINRHMKQDDPADPESWVTIGEEIEGFRLLRMAEQRRRKTTETLLDDLYALVTRLEEADDVGTEVAWEEIVLVVDDLVSNGLPPSSLELRELLRPHVSNAPTKTGSDHFERVCKCVTKSDIAGINSLRDRSTSSPTQRTEVAEAASLIAGRSVVLIGGDERPHHKEALRKSFGLKELIWVPTTHGKSIKTFEPFVARQDVAVVLLAIRWASHSFGDVERFCNRYGKPLVRLLAGYSPDQVAYQILRQCSDRLRDANSQGDGDAA